MSGSAIMKSSSFTVAGVLDLLGDEFGIVTQDGEWFLSLRGITGSADTNVLKLLVESNRMRVGRRDNTVRANVHLYKIRVHRRDE